MLYDAAVSTHTRREAAVERVIELAAVENWIAQEIVANQEVSAPLRAACVIRLMMARIRPSRVELNYCITK